jgi:glycosyltransferase involved in cell wall biosynthesis
MAPRSVREYFRNTCHSMMHNSSIRIPVSQIRNESWKKDMPLLSVIVPCYNYGAYIHEALESIRSQTFQDYEIIVVDDGSKDELTLHVLNNLKLKGVGIQTQEHSGPAKALNSGISSAQGKYVCCISADDKIDPTYFEKSLILLESNPGVSFTYPLIEAFGREQRIGFTKPFDLSLLLIYNHVCGSAIFLRDTWKQVGGFDESMPAYEDWDFWIRLGKSGFRGQLIPEPLFKWRRHPQTFGTRVDQRRPEFLTRIRSNHADLFSDRTQIEEIQEHYRDCRAMNPFLNLDSKKQYLQPTPPVGILLVSEPPHMSNRVYNFLSDMRRKRTTLISVITEGSTDLSLRIETLSNYTYNLAHFLEPNFWRDFIINLTRTRPIHFTLICNSKLGYEMSSLIKEQASCTTLDVIESEESEALCSKFDSSIDHHIVFSEDNAKSLANAHEDFRDKVILSKTVLERYPNTIS